MNMFDFASGAVYGKQDGIHTVQTRAGHQANISLSGHNLKLSVLLFEACHSADASVLAFNRLS